MFRMYRILLTSRLPIRLGTVVAYTERGRFALIRGQLRYDALRLVGKARV